MQYQMIIMTTFSTRWVEKVAALRQCTTFASPALGTIRARENQAYECFWMPFERNQACMPALGR